MAVDIKGIRHSNNTGSVGYTNIWASMNAEGMEILEDIMPCGEFTPTYYCQHGQVRDAAQHYAVHGNTRHGYYFEFPIKGQGEKLLALLMATHGLELHKEFKI